MAIFCILKNGQKGKLSPRSLKNENTYIKELRGKIKKYIKDPDVQDYFTALVTGTISSRFLRAKFTDCGMIHILAISGFHFSRILFLLSVSINSLFTSKNEPFSSFSFALGATTYSSEALSPSREHG